MQAFSAEFYGICQALRIGAALVPSESEWMSRARRRTAESLTGIYAGNANNKKFLKNYLKSHTIRLYTLSDFLI